LINATHTAQTNFNTGIQRVVRRVCECSQQLQQSLDAECIPVCYCGKRLFAAPSVAGQRSWDERTWDTAGRSIASTWQFVDQQLEHVCPAVGQRLKKLRVRLRKALYPRSLARAAAAGADWVRGRQITPRSDDIVLMLDTSWQSRSALYDLAHRHGCYIAQIVYDLLPVTHPDFFAPDIVSNYRQWIEEAMRRAHSFWAISKTVRDELYQFWQQHAATGTAAQFFAPECFRTFRLGADLARVPANEPPRAAIRNLFNGNQPVFFSVGTVEPRKNHLWLLSAFERHWSRGGQGQWVLAGRLGWNAQEIAHRIQEHPKYGSRMFWYKDASDGEVQFMYRHARATAYVSVAEGFGLPIVESLHHGTEVLASDTPIHREVGGQNVCYCSLDVLDDVVCQLDRLASSPKPTENYQQPVLVPSWSKCTDQLLRDVVARAKCDKSRQVTPSERAA
jgi:alpha-1,2-rhamnosyltransferase